MNIKRAKEEIKNTIEAYLLKDDYGNYEIPPMRQRPVLLMGPPGVGKTQIMEQIAREMKIGLVAYTITHHTRQSAIGLPYIKEKEYGGKNYSVTEYTMSEIVAAIYDKIEQTGLKEGLLFIDEINCVSETLAPTMLQFLQMKTFGNHAIPEGWIIAAAGNPPEYNKSVRDFDMVTLDRIKMIHVEANYEVWKIYAYEHDVHPAVISYLNARQESFSRIETTVDGKLFATPRGWEDLSRLIEVYEKLGKKVDREVVGQYIQFPKIAKDFANYLELYYKYENDYQIDEILNGVIRENLCNKLKNAPFDEKLNVIGLLLSRLNRVFGQVLRKGDLAELLMGQLKRLNSDDSSLSQAASMENRLQLVLKEWRNKHEEEKKAGLINRSQDYLYKDAEDKLEQYGKLIGEMELTGNHEKDIEQAWERIKELFGEENKAYEMGLSDAGEKLEHGFDFMEAAFGDGQEMVIFVTELNTSYLCIRFLKEYDCERYYQYNERLLFNRREDNIKARISSLEK